jgi:uncharacterized protein YqeY
MLDTDNLQQQIKKDMVQAMKDRNELAKNVLRMVNAEIRNAEIDKTDHTLTNEDVLKVLKKLSKQRKDSIKAYEEGGRDDLANQEKAELEIVEKYLPAQMGEQEIEKIVREVVAEMLGQDLNMGLVMREVMSKLGGQADGNLVRQVVEKVI